MTRGISSAISTALDNNVNNDTEISVGLALFLDIDGDPLYVHTGTGDISFNSQTWLGVGGLGELTGIAEGVELNDYLIKAILNHIPHDSMPDLIDELATNDQTGRDYELYFLFYPPGASIEYYKLSAGYIGKPSFIDQEASGAVELVLANETTTLKQRFFRRAAHQVQQEIYSTDDFFEYLTDTELAEIVWGGSRTTLPVTTGRTTYNNNSSYGGDMDCFLIDQQIMLASGGYKLAGEIEVGDELFSFTEPTFPKYDGSLNYMKWRGTDEQIEFGNSKVTRATISDVAKYHLINNQIKVTGSHPFFVRRGRRFMFVPAKYLIDQDYLINQEWDFVQVTSNQIIEESAQIVKISVDNHNTYYGGSIDGLAFAGHNK